MKSSKLKPQRLFLLTCFTSLAVTLLAMCATTPTTERRQLLLVPEDQMQEMGAEAFKEIQEKERKLQDKELVAAVKQVGDRVAKASGFDFDWVVEVFESKQLNAFCLPGGKIGVYSGILKVAPSNAHLAAILGHEIAHATARHGAERMSQALVAQGVLAATNISLSDSKYRNLILGALGIGVQVGVMLPYSRKHEAEADHIGTLYMAKAGYNPEFAVEVWENMAKQAGKSPPEFLSTHPNPDTRISNLRKNMDTYLKEWKRTNQHTTTETLPGIAMRDDKEKSDWK